MILQPDYSHTYQSRLRICHPTLVLSAGGFGRTAERSLVRSDQAIHGAYCPHRLAVEFDLTLETGRPHTEPSLVDILPDTLVVHIVEDIDCAAVVSEHGENPDYPIWRVVDPETIATVGNTAYLGGYASAAVGRVGVEFSPEAIDRLCRDIGRRVRAMRSARFEGWRCEEPLHVITAMSPCGSVGSNIQPLLERLRERLEEPYKVFNMVGLIADDGEVTRRVEAQALQQGFLREIRVRTQ